MASRLQVGERTDRAPTLGTRNPDIFIIIIIIIFILRVLRVPLIIRINSYTALHSLITKSLRKCQEFIRKSDLSIVMYGKHDAFNGTF